MSVHLADGHAIVTHIHLIRTHWTHWGSHSGINQFVKYLDPARFSVREQLVPDGFRKFSRLNRWAQPLLRPTSMEWYKLNDLWGELRAYPHLRSRKSHVLHYLDAEQTAFLLPQLIGARGATKIVASYHQPPEVLARVVPDRVVRCLDRVIVVSPEQASYFEPLIGTERVRFIPHGIDTAFFRPSTSPRRPGPIRCLTVGFWLRDFTAIGEVARRLSDRPDIVFDIVAPETGGLPDRSNITVHRSISDDQLRTLYREADILFLPLLEATANNALLEGMASGLPVVSTRLPAVEVYLGGAEAVLIDRSAPAVAYVDAICRLASDPGTRERMARLSRERAEQLDWRRIAGQYEDVYVD